MFDFNVFDELCSSEAFWVLHKKITRVIGVETALYLAQLLDWSKYLQTQNRLNDGWFYHTYEDVTAQTGLSRHAQIEAIKTLQKYEIMETVLKGIPRKQWFRLNTKNVKKLFKNNIVLFSASKGTESSTQADCFQHANNEELNNEVKKEKYKKEKTPENFSHLLPAKFRNDKLFQQSWEEFVQHRKTMKPRPKPLSELAAKKCINKLIKLSNSDIETAIALIDQTIEKNNDTFWPLYKSNEIAKTKQPTPPPKKKQDAHQKNIDNQPTSIWTFTTEEDLDALQEADNKHFRKHKRRMTKAQQEKWLQGHLGF